MALLETSLTCEQFKRRDQVAWWRTRPLRPVVGIILHLDKATFELRVTAEAARRWAAQTCEVATNTTVSDVFLARSRQPLDAPTMALVGDCARGVRGCVIKISHTLVSHEDFRILQEYMTQRARPDSELGIDAVFSPDITSEIKPRLPWSLCHAYSLQHNP
ncbi:uncharacterized protein N7498_004502 [Penicillium cinerascens]|uniref:Uncharacterized protein n=1 Tax=Penicillium cinerascens TaxID=70096 RepID=A0A9W9MLR1_9EURO|nr:uncharacterized protein N7498_004502 [Penicillium cinerascens]KAJ5203623.1 hypothetical protein N7498_004502 [Penicillium cinerascens]